MNSTEQVFLKILKSALSGEAYTETQEKKVWQSIVRLALAHSVLPAICEAIFSNESFLAWKKSSEILDTASRQAVTQIVREEDFLDLYEYLKKREICPAVMKGILLRSLYPKPEERISADEDLLIHEKDFSAVHEAILSLGLRMVFPEQNSDEEHEVAYVRDETGLYVEVHKKPFPPDSKAYGDLNRYFTGAVNRSKKVTIYRPSDLNRKEPLQINSLEPTDHIFYMLCHAYKHFLHGGIGIRQICDIVLFAQFKQQEINWESIYQKCSESGMKDFAGAIFRIGNKYLLREPLSMLCETGWMDKEEGALLQDILDSGVYGVSTKARAHSSNITLGAIENEKYGTRERSGLATAFPRLKSMEGRYPYLKKWPILLPMAWVQRIGSFTAEVILNQKQGNLAMESITLGKQRIALFQEYGILNQEADHRNQKQGMSIRDLYYRLADSKIGTVFRPLYYAIASFEYAFFNGVWFLQGYRFPNKQEQKLVRDNVTFIFKSFERQGMSRQLCANISRYYPDVQIVVADDSRKPLSVNRKNVTVIHLPYNSGLSVGIDAALRQVKTSFLVRLDDDELLTRRSNIHGELQFLREHPEIDLVGFGIMTAIRCREAKKNFEIYKREPILNPPRPHKIQHMTELDDGHLALNKVFNLYIARTDLVRKVGFDPNIRMADHSDFFWRASGIIASAAALDTVVWHRHNPFDRKYKRFRSDFRGDIQYIREKKIRTVQEKHKEKTNV